MVSALGSEIVDFYENGWPEGNHNDDSELTIVDGKIIMEDGPPGDFPLTEKYELYRFGVIIADDYGVTRDFSYFFNRWKKAKTTVSILIEVPRAQEEEVRKILKGRGIKVAS
jgi:hypothetical protein